MLEISMIVYLIVFCTVAAFTDWKYGKIYNKWLGLGMLPGIVLVVVYYFNRQSDILLYFTNLAAAIIIAILFWTMKMWGAGDSKLWLFVNFIYPTGLYVTTGTMLFPSMLLFMLIFIEAYIFVILESLWYRFGKRDQGITLQKEKFQIVWIWDIGFSVLLLSIVYSIMGYLLGEYYESNRIFFSVLGVLSANKLVNWKIHGKKYFTGMLLVIYILMGALLYRGFDWEMLLLTVVLVVVTQMSLKFADKYNYAYIPTSEVKEGMIMSYITIQQFYGSRVKGLPHTTDETTKSRITQSEAEAIRRWEKSKYGKDTIMVVRYIPFAIFILIGIVTYLIGVWKL